MLKTTQELKDFILWAKQAKIQGFKVGPVEVQFSAFAFIDDANIESTPGPKKPSEEKDTSKTLVDTLQTEDENDLLFYSVTNR